MKKTAFKTFVYSFVFSLFMIFGINGVFFDEKPTHSAELKIPSKNITLFLQADAVSPTIKPLPVKKIALNVLPDTTPHYDTAPLQTPDLSTGSDYAEEDSPQEIIMADNADTIPLEFGNYEDAWDTNSLEIADGTTTAAEAPPQRLPVRAEVLSISDDTPEEEAPVNLLKQEPKPEIKLAAVYTPERMAEPEVFSKPQKEEPKKIRDKSMPDLLIPLEKSGKHAIAAKSKIIRAERTAGNQVALADGKLSTQNIAIANTETEAQAIKPADDTKRKWVSMEQKKGAAASGDNPWVVAQGAKFPKNAMAAPGKIGEEKEIKKLLATGKTTKDENEQEFAANMVDNILIPIPKKILDKDDLRPRLEFPENAETLEREKEAEDKILDAQGRNIAKPAAETTKEPKKDLLSSITSMFSSSSEKKDETETPATDEKEDTGLIEKIKGRFSAQSYPTGKILPAEIRLSFQPNRAEISGNTLKWINAFAQKTIEDSSIILEIRLDGTSDTALQQKRLNLLSNILSNNGVKRQNVKVVFTEREPNSFIVRTIKTNNTDSYGMEESKSQDNGRITVW